MTQRISVHHLTAEGCRHTHEKGWEGEPLRLQTVEAIEACIRICQFAREGLQVGCAHRGYHRFDSNNIFLHDLDCSDTPEKEVIKAKWENLRNIKAYLDQLHRFGHGGDLDKIEGVQGEDPTYAAAVHYLGSVDPLYILFSEAQERLNSGEIDINYWATLGYIEDIIIKRLEILIRIVQDHTPKPENKTTFVRSRKPVLAMCSDDEL